MTAVAGDFYDYVVADDRQSGLLIADVSGHGVPAVLIAWMAQLAAAPQRAVGRPIFALFVGDELGAYWKLAESVGKGDIRPPKRVSTTTVLRRGRAPSFAAIAEWWVTEIEQNGLMLAVFDFASYLNVTHDLEPGDRLLLYTDGIVDASNLSGDFFARAGLRESLRVPLDFRYRRQRT